MQIGRFQPESAKASKKFRLLVDEDSPACQEIHGHLYYVIIKEQARTSKLGAKASALLKKRSRKILAAQHRPAEEPVQNRRNLPQLANFLEWNKARKTRNVSAATATNELLVLQRLEF